MLTKIKEDFMKTPRLIKAFILVLAIVSLVATVTACVSYGPSKNFVEKMDLRAEANLPALEKFIEIASAEQLEVAYGKEPGRWSTLQKDELGELRKAKILELRAWRYLIAETKKLIETKD